MAETCTYYTAAYTPVHEFSNFTLLNWRVEEFCDDIWAMTGGGPGFATDVLSSAVYKQYAAGFYGLSTAGNVIMFILVAAFGYPRTIFVYAH